MPQLRTSVTDPIQIAELPVGNGMLGLTFCPGKQGDSVFGAPWHRDLATDVNDIRAWGADEVITLMERHEFDMLCVPTLDDVIKSAGMRWRHLPVRDVDIPDAKFDRAWPTASREITEALARGERIAIHCRGGRGRTGLLAALILIEHGHGAEVALRLVRDVRPGSVETTKQEDWLRCHPCHLIHASLLAGALGDSMGAEIEFWSLDEISRAYPNGIRELPYAYGRKGWFTDDTQMTLFTAEGLMRGTVTGNLVVEVHKALLRWLVTQGERPGAEPGPIDGLAAEPDLNYRAAPGLTCLSGLREASVLGASSVNNSKGCGTIMRVAPVAFAVPRDRVREIAITTSALTHGHPVGQFAAAAWAELLADVRSGVGVETAAQALALEYSALGDPGQQTAEAIRRAISAQRDGWPQTVETLGGGWVAEEALSIALYAVLASSDLDAGLQIALIHSGDSDSTAAIAGNMLGLLYPADLFSHPLLASLGGRRHAFEMSAGLSRCSRALIDGDSDQDLCRVILHA